MKQKEPKQPKVKKEKPVLSEEEIKALRKKRLKWGLFAINILLLGELVYGIIHIVYSKVKENRACSISSSTSSVLENYQLNKVYVRDYVVYGENLSLFHYDYEVDAPNDFFIKEGAKFILKDECKDQSYSFTVSQYLDQNIDLSSLKEGNYHIYYKNDAIDLSLVSFEVSYDDLNYSFYSLPYKKNKSDINYTRKKIEITSLYSLILIKVNEEKFLDTDAVYDVAIHYTIGDVSETAALELKEELESKGLKVLFTDNTNPKSTSQEITSLRSMHDNKVKYAIRFEAVDESATYFYHSSKIVGYTTIDTDKDDIDFINQLGGKALGAGICNASSSELACGLTNAKHNNGVNALDVTFSKITSEETAKDLADSVFDNFNNKYLKN